jgi:hypothetical protein
MGRYSAVQITAGLVGRPTRPIRQFAVTGLRHGQPTLQITNQSQLPAHEVIRAYDRRMNIEQPRRRHPAFTVTLPPSYLDERSPLKTGHRTF